MARTVGRNLAAPLLFLNFAMYVVVMGFASWNLNKYINGQTHYPGKLSAILSLFLSLLPGNRLPSPLSRVAVVCRCWWERCNHLLPNICHTSICGWHFFEAFRRASYKVLEE